MQKLHVRYTLYPSSLLWLGSLSQAGKDLVTRCRELRTVEPQQLNRLVTEARELLAAGDANSCATVLIFLADRCREGGELILARECCESAETLFCPYEDGRQVHNWAVALYALARVVDAQHLAREAVNTYDRALAAFERALAEWRWVPECAQARRRQCERAMREIRDLRAGLAGGAEGRPPPAAGLIPVWVLSATSAGRPLLATEELEEWVEVDAASAGRADYALRVRGDSMVGAGIDDGDVVLARRTSAWPSDGQIVVVRIDGGESESVLKRFYGRGNHICLEPANDAHPLLIIVPAGTSREALTASYEQSHPGRSLEWYNEGVVHCVGWYTGKGQ